MGLGDVVLMNVAQDREEIADCCAHGNEQPVEVQLHMYLDLNSGRPEFEATKHWTVWH